MKLHLDGIHREPNLDANLLVLDRRWLPPSTGRYYESSPWKRSSLIYNG